jgi:hypothetical protein
MREASEAGAAGEGGKAGGGGKGGKCGKLGNVVMIKNVLAACGAGCAVVDCDFEGDFECHNRLIRLNGCGYEYLQIYAQTRKV